MEGNDTTKGPAVPRTIGNEDYVTNLRDESGGTTPTPLPKGGEIL
jgi:hypothetical protein